MDLLYVLKKFAASRQSLILSFFPRYWDLRITIDMDIFDSFAHDVLINFFEIGG